MVLSRGLKAGDSMSILETFLIAFKSLGENKLRTFLSVLGIVIGVASVIAMVSLGDGAKNQVLGQFSSLGSNIITISPRASLARSGRLSSETTSFNLELATQIKESIPELVDVIPSLETSASLWYEDANLRSSLVGVTPGYVNVLDYPLLIGRFINDDDLTENRLVTVLSFTVAEQLYGLDNPIGQRLKVTLNGRTIYLTVVGIMSERSQTALTFSSNQIFLPATTMIHQKFGSGTVSGYTTRFTEGQNEKDVMAKLSHYLESRLGTKDGYSITSQDSILEAMSQVATTLTLFLAGIAGIALVVGGIGIMNIMLVSVTERTREIGIRKSLGAKRKHIFSQFLLEAVILSVIGGFAGLFLGSALGQFISKFINIPFVVSVKAAFVAIGFSSFVGLFFGVYPAQKASRLNPVEALRYE